MSKYTQKAIIQTFQDMLKQMPFDKITVSAIVSKSEISSNTFYYHYRDIYDLLDTWVRIMWKQLFQDALEQMSWQDALKSVLHKMQDNSALVYHLFESLSRERMERFVFESTGDIFYRLGCKEVGNASVPETTLRRIAEYNGYSLLGFLLKFLWNRMDMDIDESVDQISCIFKGNIQWVISGQAKTEGYF